MRSSLLLLSVLIIGLPSSFLFFFESSRSLLPVAARPIPSQFLFGITIAAAVVVDEDDDDE
jgi:hypothetical protein